MLRGLFYVHVQVVIVNKPGVWQSFQLLRFTVNMNILCVRSSRDFE